MNILMTICGRAGSKGFKGKNLKIFHGNALIWYTLAVIDLFKSQTDANVDVALNTDSEELKLIVKKYPGILFIDRKKELSSDTASKISVIKDTLLQSENQTGKVYDLVIDLDLTSPLRTVHDVHRLVEKKINEPDLDVVFSVVEARRNPFFNMVIEKGNSVTLVNKSEFTARQQAPKIFDMNASMYLYDVNFLKEKNKIFEGTCGIIEMKDYLILDIDSEEDFQWMSYLYPKFMEEDKGIFEVFENIKKITNQSI
jgi:CMP-N,N'-diacetyllegionaminic acid synthase